MAYYDQPGDNGYVDDPTQTGGPTGIPDPNNPGYDTAGYPLQQQGSGPGPIPQQGTGPAPVPDGRTPTMGPATTQGPGPTPGPVGPLPGGDGLLAMFQGAAPVAQSASVGAAPVFTPPGFTPPPAFHDPTAAEAAAEPGYDFALKQGLGAVEASAAARGVINSGGTLKDIFNYGSNAATQNYQNVDTRARNNYLMNYQTQYTDPYQFAYRGAADAFAPKMAQYAAENNVSQFNAGQSNTLNYNSWIQAYNAYRNRILDTVNVNTATS